ncbi:hypothetical protein OKW76_01990 [Sphingomonas sp. S1-29]|uniref:hypothetical protein n=1 Tax=Sphingomonas sp. S1-29 TaxID=2991074 RepID=UPI0022409A52|nr:hypothetical protein [Sphingomonas sp. S1-29]UZK69857.1 hypothetical protein OKW76_01990 [Sphingomonas sp. S1-29]
MNLLPFLYALLAAITGIAAGGTVIDEPRIAASAVGQRAQAVAVAAARLVTSPLRASFEALRSRVAPALRIDALRFALAFLPADERPARRRE